MVYADGACGCEIFPLWSFKEVVVQVFLITPCPRDLSIHEFYYEYE